MTSQGSAYARFRRALDTGNLALVRAAAAELPHVDLADALPGCSLLPGEPGAYEKAVIRWLGRFCLERKRVTLDEVETALAAFEDLPLHRAAAPLFGAPAAPRRAGARPAHEALRRRSRGKIA